MIDRHTDFRLRVLMMCPRDHGELKPNFYHACAEKIFPAYGIATRFIPDLSGFSAFRWLRGLGVGKRHVAAITTIAWVFRHRKSFDIIIGWHGSALLLAVLRALVGWRRPQLCLILYRLYNPDTPRLFAFFKRAFLRIVSHGADYILSVDRSQAAAFAKTLRRDPATTIAFRYGIDYDWFANYVKSFNIAPHKNRIFSPGSAYRDDSTLYRAISDLEVEVWRTRLNGGSGIQREQIGCSTIVSVCNLPYDAYVSTCLESSAVVISAHSSDKPVGLTSLLECMALGRPVIITRGLSSRDYVIDNVTALEFDVKDSQALKNRIQRLLEDPELIERLTQAAHASVRREFDMSKTGPEFVQLLMSMTSAPFPSKIGNRSTSTGNASQ